MRSDTIMTFLALSTDQVSRETTVEIDGRRISQVMKRYEDTARTFYESAGYMAKKIDNTHSNGVIQKEKKILIILKVEFPESVMGRHRSQSVPYRGGRSTPAPQVWIVSEY